MEAKMEAHPFTFVLIQEQGVLHFVAAASPKEDVIIRKGRQLLEDQADEPPEKQFPLFVHIYSNYTGELVDIISFTPQLLTLMP